ncbi:uncharacterized protein SPAPADRAFT_61406, partial [Spathaspora passalidarum NRRL Y-27907]
MCKRKLRKKLLCNIIGGYVSAKDIKKLDPPLPFSFEATLEIQFIPLFKAVDFEPPCCGVCQKNLLL